MAVPPGLGPAAAAASVWHLALEHRGGYEFAHHQARRAAPKGAPEGGVRQVVRAEQRHRHPHGGGQQQRRLAGGGGGGEADDGVFTRARRPRDAHPVPGPFLRVFSLV